MDVTYLQRAAIAGAFVLPLVAVGAVMTQDDSADTVCFCCGGTFAPSELTDGPLETKWCAGCDAAATADPAFDCVQEDDGEP